MLIFARCSVWSRVPGMDKARGPLTLLTTSRRFRKWAAVIMALVALYMLSFGPACWISSGTGAGLNLIPVVYRPILMAISRRQGCPVVGSVEGSRPTITRELEPGPWLGSDVLLRYATLFSKNSWWAHSEEYRVSLVNGPRFLGESWAWRRKP